MEPRRKMKISRRKMRNQGVTIIELLTAMLLATIIMLGAGYVLFDCYRSWDRIYNRAYGDMASDFYTTKSAFDAEVRKSSISVREPVISTDNDQIELYYKNDWTDSTLNRYTRFYLDGDTLVAAYGSINSMTSAVQSAGQTITLCNNVTNVQFSRVGPNITMILDIQESDDTNQLTCSAVMHSE